ncbi:MAG: type II toxin-antitoxin system RelE/ParE family toxin [Phycisphaerales bacterium JB039]
MWEVEYTDEFEAWWNTLPEDVRESIAHDVGILEAVGPGLGRPKVDTVAGSRFANMKELRTQHDGEPYRTFFAFDPRRCAILLIGGNKGGDKRFYDRFIPEADRLYQEHLTDWSGRGSPDSESKHGAQVEQPEAKVESSRTGPR